MCCACGMSQLTACYIEYMCMCTRVCMCVCVCVCVCMYVCVVYMYCSLSQEWTQNSCHERRIVLYSVVVLRPARAYIRIRWGNSILLHSRQTSRVFSLHVFCCGCVGKGVVREPGGSTGDSGKHLFRNMFFKTVRSCETSAVLEGCIVLPLAF